MKITFDVSTTLAGKTIKQYFEMEGLSTTEIKRFKYDGHIWANGQSVTVRYQMKLGDKMEFATNERLQTPAFAETPAKVLYADKHLYVAYKPYGVAIHLPPHLGKVLLCTSSRALTKPPMGLCWAHWTRLPPND